MSGSRHAILGLGACLPDRVMTNADWEKYLSTSDDWIVSRTGIQRRRIASETESTLDFALGAAREALQDARLVASDLDEIIVATDTPEVYSPDTAAFIQHGLGAREIPAFDLAGSGCAGFLLGIDLARSRVLDSGGCILVIGVEVISKIMDWTDRNTAVLFGDAGAAAVVGSGDTHPDGGLRGEILATVAGTDGSRSGILGKEVGGTRRPFSAELAAAGDHNRLTMDGREVFKEAVRRMTEASQLVVERAGVQLSDIDVVVPHQANLRVIKAVAKQLNLPMDKVVVNVQDYGNTGSASVPLALWEARRDGRIKPGDLVLLTAFGAGFHWAAVLLKF